MCAGNFCRGRVHATATQEKILVLHFIFYTRVEWEFDEEANMSPRPITFRTSKHFNFLSSEKRLELKIEPKDYITKTGADVTIKLYVKGLVEDTGQSFAAQDVVELTKPALEVTVGYQHCKDLAAG